MTRAAVVLFALVGAAGAAPAPAEPVPYFATRVGARWTYRYPDADITLAVTRVERKGGAHVVSVGRVLDDGKITPHETIEASADGLVRVASVVYAAVTDKQGRVTTSEKFTPEAPPVRLLKLPAKAGERWDAMLGGKVPITFTTGREEAVKVPAGTYTAVTVEVALPSRPGDPPARARYWYAPGVGPVKWTTRDGEEIVLKSFADGKK